MFKIIKKISIRVIFSIFTLLTKIAPRNIIKNMETENSTTTRIESLPPRKKYAKNQDKIKLTSPERPLTKSIVATKGKNSIKKYINFTFPEITPYKTMRDRESDKT